MGNFTFFFAGRYSLLNRRNVCALITHLILQAKRIHMPNPQKKRKVSEMDCQSMLCFNMIEKIECAISNWLET